MLKQILSAFVTCFLLWTVAEGQTCTTLGQNPSTAFPVCGTTTFTQSSVPICGIRNIPVACFDGASYMDKNPFWYKFTCYTAGTLGFVITPMVLADDYDWQLFDITNRNPDDVYTDPSLFVGANWSFMSGTTGASAAGSSLLVCAANPITFSQMPTLIVGHQYLLLISHFTNTQSGYQLSFGGGTASITDPNIPFIQSATPNCDGTQIVVKFTKPLKCNSLTSSGSEFVVAPTGSIASATGHGCANGFTIDSVTLTLNVPLSPGNYTLAAALGSDGNTLTDNCDLSIPVGNNTPFTIPAPLPLPMGTLNTVGCAPSTITINFPDPIKCISIAGNGSDFTITGPSPVVISGVVTNCGSNGETNSITLQFSTPITTPGNFQVVIATGTDGNTLLGACNRPVPAGSSVGFTVQPQPALAMGTVTVNGCAPSFLFIDFTEPIRCNSLAADGSDFNINGPSSVVISGTNATCNSNGETTRITVQLSAPVSVSGTYQLVVATGSDGNTLLGSCLRQVAAGATSDFSIPISPPALINDISPVGCSPQMIRINLQGNVQCNSIAADGSDFRITGPSAAVVAGARGICSNGLTSSIEILLSSPIVVGGNYLVELVTGSDGNTLVNECFRSTPLSSLSFTASDTVSAAFTYQLSSDCNTNDVTFTNAGGNNINSWSWTVNGIPVSALPSFTQTFPATSQQIIQLAVSNGMCNATNIQTIQLDNKVIVDFETPAFICPEDPAQFINKSTGPINNWTWIFGNGNTDTLRDPLPQWYPVTGNETVFSVTLTASNNNGCSDSKTKSFPVLATCLIAVPTGFTPNNDGLNDYLYPLNAFKADELDFKVYNRWGELVFSTNDWTRKWDGKVKGIPQGTGVFAWTLRYKDRTTGLRHAMKGTTVLIR